MWLLLRPIPKQLWQEIRILFLQILSWQFRGLGSGGRRRRGGRGGGGGKPRRFTISDNRVGGKGIAGLRAQRWAGWKPKESVRSFSNEAVEAARFLFKGLSLFGRTFFFCSTCDRIQHGWAGEKVFEEVKGSLGEKGKCVQVEVPLLGVLLQEEPWRAVFSDSHDVEVFLVVVTSKLSPELADVRDI